MELTDDDRAVLATLDTSADPMVRRAMEWCAINSGSYNAEGLTDQRAALAMAMASLPGRLDVAPLADSAEIGADGASRARTHPDALRLTVRPDAPVQVVLTGHYDTVYPAETAFRVVTRRADGARARQDTDRRVAIS